MRRAIRENALTAAAAAAACAVMGWLALYGFAWNDYDIESRPAVEALLAGHLREFAQLAPAYGGSLLLRAPFALPAELWGGGPLAVYRLLALPCLAASAILAVWLAAGMRAAGRPPLARAIIVGVCVANPLTLRALELGHPEELLGACLCVAAVLLAARGRPGWAGVVLGLAVANKAWAVLAAPAVVLALPPGTRLRALAWSLGAAAAALAPLLLLSGQDGALSRAGAVASGPSVIFQPWQALWFFGHHGALVHGLFGAAKPGYRAAPGWAGTVSHPLVIAAGIAAGAGAWAARLRGRGGALAQADALMLLALTLLLRCLLDTWDTVYYALPFVLALAALESGRRTEAPPTLALSASVLLWIAFQWLPARVSPDAQAVFFLACAVPAALALSLALFSPRAPRRRRDQPTTVSSFGRLVSSSHPDAVTTTRSSILTPSSPGR